MMVVLGQLKDLMMRCVFNAQSIYPQNLIANL